MRQNGSGVIINLIGMEPPNGVPERCLLGHDVRVDRVDTRRFG